MAATAQTHASALEEIETALSDLERACLGAQDHVNRRVAATTSRIADEVKARRRDRDIAVEQLRQARDDGQRDVLVRAVARAEARWEAAQQAQRQANQASAQAAGATARFGREIANGIREGHSIVRSARGDVDAYLGAAGRAAGRVGIAPGTGSGASAKPVVSREVAGGGGVQEVPISQIDTSDRDITSSDFGKGYSPEDLKWAMNALHEVVLPALAAGHDADYFAKRDAAEGRMGTRSYSDTHSGFFHDDHAIRLSSTGGRYHVENGYHRIWVARQMGLTHVPARVVK
jgi:hypothetical protein